MDLAKRIWSEVMSSCMNLNMCVEWEDVIQWSVNALQGGGLKFCLCKLSFGVVMYHLWKQMNELLRGNTRKTEKAIVVRIRWEIRARITPKGRFTTMVECVTYHKR
jgi:hypothetical protein